MRHILVLTAFVSGIAFATFAIVGYAQGIDPNFVLPRPVLPMIDVGTNQWYTGSVNKVISWGVMTANSNRSFLPGQNINRAQMAVIMDKYNDYLERNSLSDKAANLRLTADFLKRHYQEINSMLNGINAQNRSAECQRLQPYKQEYLSQYVNFFHQKENLQNFGYTFSQSSEPLINEVQTSYSDGNLNNRFGQVCGS